MSESDKMPDLRARDCAAWLSRVREMVASKDNRILVLRARFEERLRATGGVPHGMLDERQHRNAADQGRGLRERRVGMVVTWPARKAWGGIKCLRENGIKYTARHFVWKVARTIGKILYRNGGKLK